MKISRRSALLGASGAVLWGTAARAQDVTIKRRYVDGPYGQIHVRVAEPATNAKLETPLACFHYSPGSGRLYDPLLPHLAKDRMVMAFDTPGYGYSDPPPDQPTIADYARALKSAMAQLAPGQQFDVMGQLTGSLIATELAATEPDSVRKAVLSRAPVFSEDTRTNGVAEMLRRWRERQTDAGGQYIKDRLNRGLGSLGDGDMPERYLGAFIDSLLPGHNWVYGEVAAFSYRADLMMPKITQPVLFLTWIEEDQEDGGTFGSMSEWTRGKDIIPNVTHHNFSGLGRWPWQDQPDVIADRVLAFLDA